MAFTPATQAFQSTLPAWGATISMSRPSADHSDFNPRSPHGERLPKRCAAPVLISYFNPRSPHGERQVPFFNTHRTFGISIHAPRMGSDEGAGRPAEYDRISIHAPRMGSDSTVKAYSNDRIKRSTLREPHFLYSKNAYFSPIVSMCATTSRTKKSENQSFIRIISRLGTYVFHLRLVSIPQIIEPYAVRLPVHQHFQCGTK